MKIIIRLFTLAILLFVFVPIQAQFKTTGESTGFEEQADGVSKIIQMKNGNTWFLHISARDGIDFRIYDASHAEKISDVIYPSFGKLKNAIFQNAFTVKNDVVLFISNHENNAPVLYRLIIDGGTGKLKQETILAAPVRHGGLVSYLDPFTIKKDPIGDNYAIKMYNAFEDDQNKRIEIIQYGDDNVETNRNFLIPGNDDGFNFFVYMDMQVIDAGKVNVILYNGKEKYFYNTKPGRMVMASIDKKQGKVTYTNIELPGITKFIRCISKYNTKTKKMYLLLKDGNNNNSHFIKFNTQTNTSEAKQLIVEDEKINDQYKERFSLKRGYSAGFSSFTVNDDESYTVIYEESFSDYDGSSSYYYTGKILVMGYGSDGKVLSGYIVPKLYNTNIYSYFKSPFYMEVGKDKYVFINDSERNNEVKKNKFVTIIGLGDCDAFLYKLSGTELVPERNMLFGSNKDGHNLSAFSVSDFSESNNTLVILKVNRKSPKNKAASLVWMQPQ